MLRTAWRFFTSASDVPIFSVFVKTYEHDPVVVVVVVTDEDPPLRAATCAVSAAICAISSSIVAADATEGPIIRTTVAKLTTPETTFAVTESLNLCIIFFLKTILTNR
jgi:hypothetical protein